MGNIKEQLTDWKSKESEVDLAWIQENLHVLAPKAQSEYEEWGRGLVFVNTDKISEEAERSFGYLTQSEIEEGETELVIHMVGEYDPQTEIVVSLVKYNGQGSTYRVLIEIPRWAGMSKKEHGPQMLRGHELLPQEIRELLPDLYSGEEYGLDAKALVKFFTPDSNWSWFTSEFDGDDILFGLVVGLEIELGYWSLAELEAVRGPWGLPIERDLYFEPKTLNELLEMHRNERGQ